MATISFHDAFSSSTKDDDKKFTSCSEKLTCPLASKCVFTCSLAHHLRVDHKIREFAVPADGMIEIHANAWIKPEVAKRSSILLSYDGSLFVWMLESRLRADCETQTSIIVQMIPEEDKAHIQALKYSIAISVTSENSAVQPLKWSTVIDSAKTEFEKSEKLLSRGEGLVALYPANRDHYILEKEHNKGKLLVQMQLSKM